MTNNGEFFLTQLRARILHLPGLEVDKAISYYRESLEDKLEDGLSDEEAIESFGSIDDIVKSIEEEVSFTSIVRHRVKEKSDKSGVNKILLAIVIILTFPIWLPIGLVALIFCILLYTFAWVIPIVIGIIYFSLVLSAGASVISGAVRIFTISIGVGCAYIGFGLVLASICIIFYKPFIMLWKLLIKLHVVTFKKLKQKLIRQ